MFYITELLNVKGKWGVVWIAASYNKSKLQRKLIEKCSLPDLWFELLSRILIKLTK